MVRRGCSEKFRLLRVQLGPSLSIHMVGAIAKDSSRSVLGDGTLIPAITYNDEEGLIDMNEEMLKVIVHYAAAKKPYEQDHASRHETVGTLKTNVLNAFGLTEGQHADGNTYTYTLYHSKMALENLAETL